MGDGARRHARSRSRSCTGATRRSTVRRPRCSTATAPTRTRPIPRSARRACRCSTAGSSSRSRTCAAAARWAGRGTRSGRLEHKMNTFTDFIACAEHLDRAEVHERRLGSPRAAAAPAACSWARSRTCAPTCSRAIVAEVPFVDVVTTMLDPVAPAHDHRVGGVGRPARARRVRAHEGVLALRQRRASRRIPRCS